MSGRGKKYPRSTKASRTWARGRRAWGVSERGGFRTYLRTLVEDGQYPGLMVTRDEWEPRHPQEYPVDATDAPALERPSPERELVATVAPLPGVVPGDESRTNWILPAKGEVGHLTPIGYPFASNQVVGLEGRGETGTLATTIGVSDVNAFVAGVQSAGGLGNLVGTLSEVATAVGNEAQSQVGTLTVNVGVEVSLMGNQAAGQAGGLVVVGSVWTPSFFVPQFQGITPNAREQLQ